LVSDDDAALGNDGAPGKLGIFDAPSPFRDDGSNGLIFFSFSILDDDTDAALGNDGAPGKLGIFAAPSPLRDDG